MPPVNKRELDSGSQSLTPEEEAFVQLKKTQAFSAQIESYISNPRRSSGGKRNTSGNALDLDAAILHEIRSVSTRVSTNCTKERKKWSLKCKDRQKGVHPLIVHQADKTNGNPTDKDNAEHIKRCLRFSDAYSLEEYQGLLRYAPQLVNVVSLALVSPVIGSTTKLPLDLKRIATRCNGAYFAPKRFASVQLAYHKTPRARVLVFHTGRLVGTGTTGIASSRLAIMQAILQLAEEANIFLKVDSFEVINSVGSVTLGATVNCEAFAQSHTSSVHYDPSSFVGLTWRPSNVPICVEVYSTGRANIPGAKTHRQLLSGFAKVVPELLAYSSSGRPGGKKGDDTTVPQEPQQLDETNPTEDSNETEIDMFDGWAVGPPL